MKKVTYLILTGIICVFPSCKSPNSEYEEYIVPNGLYYPGKALDLEAFPGRERIEITWKSGTDPNVVKARLSWNSNTKWEDVDVAPGDEVIRRMLEPMAENTYSFVVRTYDAEGNVSVPVEVISAVYGDIYERSLQNRSLKSVMLDGAGLHLEWESAETTETGLELEYTNTGGVLKKDVVPASETSVTIPIKAGEAVYYTTMYRPEKTAIDIFRAPRIKVLY